MNGGRARLAVWLLAGACAAHIVAYLVAAPEHVVDSGWPLHARFHVLQAILWVVGLDVVLALTALRGLVRGERWSWWLLLVGGVAAHASYFIALLAIRGGGPPETSAHVLLGALFIVYGVGLALAKDPRRT